MQVAYCVRGWSKDSRRVGAVLVNADRRIISTGCNGFPSGIEDSPERLQNKELKNKLMIHAEVNAVFNSVAKPEGSTLYSTRFPCHSCAAALVQNKIIRVVAPEAEPDHPTWGESHLLALRIFKEAGIEITVRA